MIFLRIRPGIIIFLFIGVLALTFNAILAFVNAHFLAVSMTWVIAVEAMLYLLCLSYIFFLGISEDERLPLVLLIVAFTSCLLTSISSGYLFLDFLRNMLIVFVFFMLGRRASFKQVEYVFWCAFAIVLFILLLEIFNIDYYVHLFEPATYYSATRGNELKEFNDLGVFGNAIGFEERFSYGIFSGPRTSSIFLEQVSLANFSAVVMIYYAVFKDRLSVYLKWFIFSFVTLVLITNESRTALIFVVFSLTFVWFMARANYVWLVFLAPTIIVFGVAYVGFFPPQFGDNIAGRVYLGFSNFAELQLVEYILGAAGRIKEYYDSGYAYIFASGTALGAFAFWYFLLFSVKVYDRGSNVFVWLVNIFFSLNLIIGGTAVYSVKVAFLLWLIAGYISKGESRYEDSISFERTI